VLEEESQRVAAVFVAGQVAYMAGEVAGRFLA
jgi:hypothetical protein